MNQVVQIYNVTEAHDHTRLLYRVGTSGMYRDSIHRYADANQAIDQLLHILIREGEVSEKVRVQFVGPAVKKRAEQYDPEASRLEFEES
jgi:hypothetical protein